MLLEHGAKVNIVFNEMTPLKFAITNNVIEAIELLIQYKADIDHSSDKSTTTPLLTAVTTRNYKAAKILLENGALIDKTSIDDDITAIELVVWQEYYELLKLVLQYNADGSKSPISDSILYHIAIYAPEYFQGVADDYNINAFRRTDNGFTLKASVLQSGNISNLKYLESRSFDYSLSDTRGRRFINYAVVMATTEILEYLLSKYSYDLISGDEFHKTPLEYAIERGNIEVIWLIANSIPEDAFTSEYRKTLIKACNQYEITNRRFIAFLSESTE